MKTILCYGDSNTYGSPGNAAAAGGYRHPLAARWTSVAQRALGPDYHLIVEGLPGRTTVHDDPIEGAHKNGRRTLLALLESHTPLEAVVLMLGTNDLKARFGLNAGDIAAGVGVLLKIIHNFSMDYGPIRTLVVCPPPVLEVGAMANMFAGAAAKSRQLAPAYRDMAQAYGAAFLDAGAYIQSSPHDGIHFEAADHAQLGQIIAQHLAALCA